MRDYTGEHDSMGNRLLHGAVAWSAWLFALLILTT